MILDENIRFKKTEKLQFINNITIECIISLLKL